MTITYWISHAYLYNVTYSNVDYNVTVCFDNRPILRTETRQIKQMIKSYTDALYSFASSDYENCNIVYSHVLTITFQQFTEETKKHVYARVVPSSHTLQKQWESRGNSDTIASVCGYTFTQNLYNRSFARLSACSVSTKVAGCAWRDLEIHKLIASTKYVNDIISYY